MPSSAFGDRRFYFGHLAYGLPRLQVRQFLMDDGLKICGEPEEDSPHLSRGKNWRVNGTIEYCAYAAGKTPSLSARSLSEPRAQVREHLLTGTG